MIRLDCTTARRDGVTLVTALVENDGPRRRVRLAAAGDVWPPRNRGVPAAGWDDDGVTLTLDAGARRTVGYATPDALDGESDPLTVLETERLAPTADHEPQTPVPAVDATPSGVVRALEAPAPPRTAIPDACPSGGVPSRPDAADTGGHAAVADWLAAVERRVEQAEALADADTLDEATTAVDDAGGLEAVRDLTARLASDYETLARLCDRAETLAERGERATVPVEAFDRLA